MDKYIFKYRYDIKRFIEGCTHNSFKKVKYESEEYILYGNGVYNAVFLSDKTLILNDIREKKKIDSIKESNEKEEYLNIVIDKQYISFNFRNIPALRKREFSFLNETGGMYINPEFEFGNDKITIIKDDKIIGCTRDKRNISLIKGISKERDLVVADENILSIYTLNSIEKYSEFNTNEFNITIYGENEKKYERYRKYIEDGCDFKGYVWIFLVEGTIGKDKKFLILPDEKYAECEINGNNIIVKKVYRNSRSINGQCYLRLIEKQSIRFEWKESVNIEDLGDSDEVEFYSELEVRKIDNSDFNEMITKYKQIEEDVLQEAKESVVPLKYSALEKDRFIIKKGQEEFLEEWSRRIGSAVEVNGTRGIVGNVNEVGTNYISVDFKDDSTRASIPKKSGQINISFLGDDVVKGRRDKAIKILENKSCALPSLSSILAGTHEFETYNKINTIKKYEKGNLVEKQIKAIEGSLNTKDIYLIQGPPGTGKTTVIRRIVEKIMERDEEALITSYQNLAVDNVLTGFRSGSVIPYRLGSEDNKVMFDICSNIAENIKKNIKNNVSFDTEEGLLKLKEDLIFQNKEIYNAKIPFKETLERVRDLIYKYYGENSEYTEVTYIIDEYRKLMGDSNVQLSIDKIEEILPKKHDFDIEFSDGIENTIEYLNSFNESNKESGIYKALSRLKTLYDEEIFEIEDEEYQNIKKSVLRMIRNNKETDTETDDFQIKLKLSAKITEIIGALPTFIEDKKYKHIREFHDKISVNPMLLEEVLNKFPDIRGTTCQKVGGKHFNEDSKGIDYEYVIVDECARANPLDLLIPLIKGKKVILVGDHKQLPHMLENYIENKFKEQGDYVEEKFEKYIQESIFGRLFNELPDDRKVMLDTQYRMTKEIGDLVSELFYDNKLKTGTSIVNDTPIFTDNSLISINVLGRENKLISGSYINKEECEKIKENLLEYDKKCNGVDKKISVGIISFYRAQVNYLRDEIRVLNLENLDVHIGTVDAYQGLEKDIIILSTVRTRGVGFTSNPNRLNVSISRAKKLLIVFGDISNLKSDKIFKAILEKCKMGDE